MRYNCLSMKRIGALILLGVLGILSSCREDGVPPVTIFFQEQSSLTAETIGEFAIAVNLSRPAPEDIEVNYTVTGSAQLGEDFTAPGSFVIEKDSIQGYIVITILDDNEFEFDPNETQYFGETVNITLSGVSGNGILASDADFLTHKLLIADNEPIAHSMIIELTWDSGDGTPGDVDMDLLLFILDPQEGAVLVGESQQIGTDFEGIVVGTPAPDAEYGLAYRYFEGSSDALNFKAKFTAKLGTVLGNAGSIEYEGVYTQANINGDLSAGASVQIVQTFRKVGSDYSNFSEINIPESGSRARSRIGQTDRTSHIGNVVN